MMEFLRFMFRDFGTFLGILLLIYFIGVFFMFIWNRYWRHKNIRLHGYPPPHCDADGDLKQEIEDEEEND